METDIIMVRYIMLIIKVDAERMVTVINVLKIIWGERDRERKECTRDKKIQIDIIVMNTQY